jgi:uncharacterized damage-inducible protein DinB
MHPTYTNELVRCLTGEAFAAAPSHILESLDEALAHREFSGVPRTIYAELWHIAFWQQISLDWVSGIPTPNPSHAASGFPSAADTAAEPWPQLCERFFTSLEAVAAIAANSARLEVPVQCPSPAGHPLRTMTVREQLENLAGHNAYHFGRIVLLRQMAGSWPPPSGGFTW